MMVSTSLWLLLPLVAVTATSNANASAIRKYLKTESPDVQGALAKLSRGQVRILRLGTARTARDTDKDDHGDRLGIGRMLEHEEEDVDDGIHVNETAHNGTKETYYVDWAQRGEMDEKRDRRNRKKAERNNKRKNRQNNRQNNNRQNNNRQNNDRPNSRPNNQQSNGRNNRPSNGRQPSGQQSNGRNKNPNNQGSRGRNSGPNRGTRNQTPDDEVSSSQTVISPKPSKNPSTPSPSKLPMTKDPTTEPTKKTTKKPTDGPTMAPSPSPTNIPTAEPSTVSPTKEPTMLPTKLPSAQPTPNPTQNPTESPTKESDNSDETLQTLIYPHVRYTKWTELQNEEKNIARETLGYVRNSWNNLYVNEIEANSFEDLDEDVQQGAIHLGLNTEVWNCYINHYTGLYWHELQDVGIAPHYESLGWTKAMWDDGEGQPETEELFWEELSMTEKEAAINICFVENIWNGIALNDW